jgi:hypothetical protein
MATQDNRVRINADGKKVVMIRRKRDMSPMTLQTSTTMDAMCRLLFKIKSKQFERLPEGWYGNWALYTEYRGLHYYLVVDDFREDKSFYDGVNTELLAYNAIRTNYKIPEIIMTPSECVNPDDEVNFRFMTKHGISGSLLGGDEPWNIKETLFYSRSRTEFYSYNREEVDKSCYYHDCLSKEQEGLTKYASLPYGYSLDTTEERRERSGFLMIYYDAMEILSITEKEYNDTVNMIFTKAQQKRNSDYMELVRKISPLNDNCIESILQYVF